MTTEEMATQSLVQEKALAPAVVRMNANHLTTQVTGPGPMIGLSHRVRHPMIALGRSATQIGRDPVLCDVMIMVLLVRFLIPVLMEVELGLVATPVVRAAHHHMAVVGLTDTKAVVLDPGAQAMVAAVEVPLQVMVVVGKLQIMVVEERIQVMAEMLQAMVVAEMLQVMLPVGARATAMVVAEKPWAMVVVAEMGLQLMVVVQVGHLVLGVAEPGLQAMVVLVAAVARLHVMAAAVVALVGMLLAGVQKTIEAMPLGQITALLTLVHMTVANQTMGQEKLHQPATHRLL